MYSNKRIHRAVLFYNQKKGRKNSTPKPTLTVSLSPDGVVTTRFMSNLGSFSSINFLMNLESIIGICSINLAISTDALADITASLRPDRCVLVY